MSYIATYARFLRRFLKNTLPIRVVVDSSNGVSGLVFRELKKLFPRDVSLFLINDKPDGAFPAHGPNPTTPQAARDLARAVRAKRADLGAVLDGDGDRVFFVDDRGRRLSSDASAILLAREFTGGALITPLSGYPLREYFAKERRPVFDCRVGHFFIKKEMRARRIPFAPETSGHYYFKDFFYADSGILAMIIALNQVSLLKAEGISLSGWVDTLPHYPRIPETNFRVTDKRNVLRDIEARFKQRARRISKIDGLTMEFGAGKDAWWFNVRLSNTEDLLRLNIEAKRREILGREFRNLRKALRTT